MLAHLNLKNSITTNSIQDYKKSILNINNNGLSHFRKLKINHYKNTVINNYAFKINH